MTGSFWANKANMVIWVPVRNKNGEKQKMEAPATYK
jgi:hypothetical protein